MSDSQLMLHIRTQLNLSQTEMAHKVGYSAQDAISKIETGRRELSGPARKCLQYLAELNGIDL